MLLGASTLVPASTSEGHYRGQIGRASKSEFVRGPNLVLERGYSVLRPRNAEFYRFGWSAIPIQLDLVFPPHNAQTTVLGTNVNVVHVKMLMLFGGVCW